MINYKRWNSFINFYIIFSKVKFEEREEQILLYRFFCNLKYREIRKHLNYKISRQRIQQIINKCIEKLKKYKISYDGYTFKIIKK